MDWWNSLSSLDLSQPDSILSFLNQIPPSLLYLFLFLSSFAENIFPPWPSDLINILAGFLAARGYLDLTLAMFFSIAGNIPGAVLMYTAGRKLMEKGHGRLHALPGSRIFDFASPRRMRKTGVWMEKYGFFFVFLSRFFAGIRFFVSLLAGAFQLSFPFFLLSFFAGVILWVAILMGAGYLAGDHWHSILNALKTYSNVFNALLLGILLLWMIRKFIYAKR